MKKFILTPLAFVLIICSCENEIPYNLPSTEKKLVMNAFINANSTENILYLNFTGKSVTEDVDDARVEVRINGVQRESPRRIPASNFMDRQMKFQVSNRFEPGDVVRIDAYASGDTYHVWAEETVPHPLEVVGIDTVPTHYPLFTSPFKQLRYTITMNDRPDEQNFYRIVLEHRNYISGRTYDGKDTVALYKNYDMWTWEDIVLTDGRPASSEELEKEMIDRVQNYYGIFPDIRFANSQYEMIVSASYFNELYMSDFHPSVMNTYTLARIMSITESEYYYLNVLNYIDSDMVDEYLTEPVKLPSNVNGGNGIVGFSTETTQELHVVKDKPVMYYGW